jgi:hypothetical protein
MPFSEALKASVRRRSLGRCCVCQEPFVDVHHIIPQAEGGPDTDDNAAPLCPNCHRRYGDNPRQRPMIREFRDNWYEQIATKLVQVEFTIELVDHGPRLQTFDDFERHILDLSVDRPMAAFLQLYEQITEQVRIVGRALEMQNTEIWNIPVGVALLRAHIQDPHPVVRMQFEILEHYAELYDKTIMPEVDDEPVTDHDLLQNIALGLKWPRLIRDNLKFISFEGRPKIWPVLEKPPES